VAMRAEGLVVDGLSFRHRISAPSLKNPWATRQGAGIHGVSFSVPAGSIVGLVGPNGAGKTTLLHLLSGLRTPESGSVALNGKEWKDMKSNPEARTGIGFMPDGVRWQGNSTPTKVLRRMSIIRSVDSSKLLELVGLKNKADETLDRLSAGMRQRLSLACALLGSPTVLLLDEPFTGLDPVAQKALQELLRQLADRGTTIIISSHLLLELEALVERVVLLHQGQVIIEGKLDSVRKRLGLDRRLLVEGSKGDAREVLASHGEILEYHEGWTATLHREDGWSLQSREELVTELCNNGHPPYRVETELADLAEILSAATGSEGISMDLADSAMVPLARKEVEEE
jgi:ABC-2 type transport system ATP-binding protein